MGFKKGSIGDILMKDLIELRADREVLINALKNRYSTSKDLNYITNTITTYNAIIKELEHIIDESKLAKKSK